MPAKRQIIPKMALLAAGLAALGALAGLSCSPQLLEGDAEILNPIEILNRSPRIYQIAFKAFADSIETARASAYLAGSLDVATSPGDVVQAALDDSTRVVNLAPRQVAEVEYIKARRRFDAGADRAAGYHLKRAMEADPTYRPAYLLLGDMLLERMAVEEARDVFGKVLEQDSTDSDALVGLARCHALRGRISDARRALVDAVIFDRVNLKAWSLLGMVAGFDGCRVANHDAPELGLVRKLRGRHLKILIDDSLKECPVEATAWIAYASERAVWKYEDKYKRNFGVGKYAATFEEDIDCYMVLAAAWKTLAQQDSSALLDSVACDPVYLEYLERVAEDGYLVSHVLFDHVCIKAPGAARYFTSDVIARMREYVDTYVIVPKS
jgi:tetratricopeptide (TPR) repeat protein